MIRLEDKGRKYKRYRPSVDEKLQLADKGLQWVLSSNVSAVGVDGDDMIVRFHNGAIYQYTNQAKMLNSILTSNSKGHWIWVYLRRKNIPYRKIGRVSFETDNTMSDEEMFQKLDTDAISVQEPQVLDQRDVITVAQPKPKGINILKSLVSIVILDNILDLGMTPINIIK